MEHLVKLLPWRRQLAMLSVIAVITAIPLAAAAASSRPTIVRAALLIDGKTATPRANVAVLIRGNLIEGIYDRDAKEVPADAEIIDLGAATLLPGLIDTHTHIFLQGEVPADGGYDVQLLRNPLAFRVARAVVSARRALEQGFTTLRDVETEGAGYGCLLYTSDAADE